MANPFELHWIATLAPRLRFCCKKKMNNNKLADRRSDIRWGQGKTSMIRSVSNSLSIYHQRNTQSQAVRAGGKETRRPRVRSMRLIASRPPSRLLATGGGKREIVGLYLFYMYQKSREKSWRHMQAKTSSSTSSPPSETAALTENKFWPHAGGQIGMTVSNM